MMNIEDLKDAVTCKIVNTENNKDYLIDKPTEKIEDMSVVFAAVIKETEEGRMSLPITNELMEKMGVDQAQLKEMAMNNLAEQDYSFKSMREVLASMMFPDGIPENDPMVDMMLPPEDPEMQMYVLSNSQNVFGASEILNQKAMDEIAEKLGGDFVVLPSSVHETIILPLNGDMDPATMESMVQEINSGVVSAEDKLSDHVFQYDSKEHELVRMDKMEELKQEKEADKSEISEDKTDKGEKTDKTEMTDKSKSDKAKSEKAATQKSSSLQDRISKKQTEVDNREAARPHPTKKKDVALA